MKKLLTLLVCLAGFALAQTMPSADNTYVVSRTVVLTASADALTIQQPATSSKTLRMIGVYIACSAACTASVERDGAAATATAATIVPTRSGTPVARAKAWGASNVGAGSVVGGAYQITTDKVIPLNSMSLFGDGTGKNVTVKIASMTGTVNYVVMFSEER